MTTMRKKQTDNPSHVTDFATKLNDYIQRYKGNLTLLASKSGITPGYLYMLRHGIRKYPSRDVIRRLAMALDMPLEDALKAAGLSTRPFGTHALSEKRRNGSRAVIPEQTAFADWGCQFNTGRGAFHVYVKHLGEDIFQVQLNTTPSEPPGGDKQDCKVQWFADGQKRAEIIASTNEVILTLRSGEHEFRCRWEEEEFVLKIPVGIGRGIEPPSME
jgi:transcriptional regulator with XRE-family HTH domain